MLVPTSRHRLRGHLLAIATLALTIACSDDASRTSSAADGGVMGEDAGAPPSPMDGSVAQDTSPPTDSTPVDQGCMPTDPPTEERCDAVDNDCDGVVDEDLQRRCFDGPAGTQGRGACSDGLQTCTAGAWGLCEEQVLPAAEQCNGVDEDCDGEVDEAVVQTCGDAPNEGEGTCAAPTQMCVAGDWGACGEPIGPVEEECDGRDNDCDGVTDEGFADSDSDGFADCVDGDTDGDGLEAAEDNCPIDANPDQSDLDGDGIGDICDDDADGDGYDAQDDCDPLDASRSPDADEQCNGLDNDCDGMVDEALTRPCFDGPEDAPGRGLCAEGVATCIGGAWSPCEGQVLPMEEACNAVDDDCDGLTDETLDPGWPDADRDGFGDDSVAPVCPRTPDLVSRGGDCDDDDPQINTGNEDDPADDAFIDENCDGIDGVLESTMFVRQGADEELADGTQAAPFGSISRAIQAAQLAGYSAVGVALGAYDEAITMVNGVSVIGGYDPDNEWQRGDDRQATVRNDVPDGPVLTTVWANDIDDPTMISDLIIETGDQDAPGGSTYGVYARDASELTIRRCLIRAGRAGDGAVGAPGGSGEAGANGGGGGDCGGAVGNGGVSPCGQDGFRGGSGSNVRERGQSGQPEGCGGDGGDRGGAGAGRNGSNGCSGADGLPGNNGDGFSNSAVRNDLWVVGAGSPGSNGEVGTPGGGGGGGGGAAVIRGTGGAGGGGGAGACGGSGGRGGAHGGGSFAIFSVRSAGLSIEFCELSSGPGGAGGQGGLGGSGGQGGRGGGGGNGAEAFACGGLAGPGDGGDGGDGGNGGPGGSGQAGNGGPSYAIMCSGGGISVSDTSLTPGLGGDGGDGPAAPGREGDSGEIEGCD